MVEPTPELPRPSPVDRVQAHGMTPELFRRTYERGTPVVLRGLLDAWPIGKWNFDRVWEHWPKRPVPGRATRTDGSGQELEDVTPERVSELLSTTGKPAAGHSNAFVIELSDIPELDEATPPPRVHRGAPRRQIYMGFGATSGMHYHPIHHALICEAHGRKRVLLHPPSDTTRLYPRPVLESSQFYASRVDFVRPDFSRFPKLVKTHPLEVVLEPGEALFLPVHWWHAVYGLGPALSVSYFWRARLLDHHFPSPGLRTLAGMWRWYRLYTLEQFFASLR